MRPLLFSIGFVSMALCLTGCGDTHVTRYATIEDAKKDRLFERGWVPQALPDTAVMGRDNSRLATRPLLWFILQVRRHDRIEVRPADRWSE